MDSFKQMYENLRHCYECDKNQPCLGCPYNGDKLDILQYLSNKFYRGGITLDAQDSN